MVSKMIFEKAWEIAKLDPYEMAVAEKFSDPRDFMTGDRMRQKLMGMPFDEVLSGANEPMGDLDFSYLRNKKQLEGMADEDVKAIYEQMAASGMLNAEGDVMVRPEAFGGSPSFPDETNRAADRGKPTGPPDPIGSHE